MTVIRLVTEIRTPIEACFDLARSVDAHVTSAGETNERAIAGVTSGLLSLGDEVTWEARHFGVTQRLVVRITEMDRPRRFVDEMVRGAFRHFRHVHEFEAIGEITRMRDAFEYSMPLGVLGTLANVVAVERHMRQFLERRNATLKSMAEMS